MTARCLIPNMFDNWTLFTPFLTNIIRFWQLLEFLFLFFGQLTTNSASVSFGVFANAVEKERILDFHGELNIGGGLECVVWFKNFNLNDSI